MSDPLQALRDTVGETYCITQSEAMASYMHEWRGLFPGQALAVVRPANTDETSRVVNFCRRANIGIVPQGGNTGLCGGASPHVGQVLLSLDRLNSIRDIDVLDDSMIVESGCILTNVQSAATAAGRFFPLSLGAEGSCTIGGNLSTNAGGVNVLRYGNAREQVLGLEVVLPDGRIWNGLNRLRKNNTGYDLKQLFIGAEGTLGVITAAALKLYPAPAEAGTAFVALKHLDASLELLALARSFGQGGLTSFELISRTPLSLALNLVADCKDPLDRPHDWYVLMDFSAPDANEILTDMLSQAIEQGMVKDGVIAASAAQAQALWRLREGVVEAQRHAGASIKHDVSVPVSRVPEFIRRASERVHAEMPGIRICAFGHLGDGNIHYNLTQPESMAAEQFLKRWNDFNDLVYPIVMELGGSFSAEHGIGQLKLHDMARYKSDTELNLMRAIKTALDPTGIMNPGKVLPDNDESRETS